jgi:hypothetical protein
MTMSLRLRVARLFTIKTRTEAWLVTYAIAVGAVERGRHYIETVPGWAGWMLALLCTGVVFLAGAKLLDSVKAPAPAVAVGPYSAWAARPAGVSRRSRPTPRWSDRASASRLSHRTD